MDRISSQIPDTPRPDSPRAGAPAERGGPPFWEEWRGTVPDEEIEFVRIVFEQFTGAWD